MTSNPDGEKMVSKALSSNKRKSLWWMVAMRSPVCTPLFVLMLLSFQYITFKSRLMLDWDSSQNNEGGNRATDPFSTARDESYGFFYDVTDEQWSLFRDIYMTSEDHPYPDKPLTYHPEAAPGEDNLPAAASRGGRYKSYPSWYQNVSAREAFVFCK